MPEVALAHKSTDGTWKWLFRLDSGNSIECVYIPETNRGTLCISTQVGCALDCSFCATAREGFNRNLSTAEIIGQLRLANQLLAQDAAQDATRSTSQGTVQDTAAQSVLEKGTPMVHHALAISC